MIIVPELELQVRGKKRQCSCIPREKPHYLMLTGIRAPRRTHRPLFVRTELSKKTTFLTAIRVEGERDVESQTVLRGRLA